MIESLDQWLNENAGLLLLCIILIVVVITGIFFLIVSYHEVMNAPIPDFTNITTLLEG